MNINYPAEYEIGDIVFTCISAALFGQISAASNCWSNHVGIIIGHNGEDFLVAESRVPLSTITTLSRFIKRSANQRYAIKRLDAGLTEQQKQRIVEQVPSRLKRRTKNAKAFHDKCENFSFRASNETAVLITAFYSLHGDHLGYG